jgi:hypothetical protein
MMALCCGMLACVLSLLLHLRHLLLLLQGHPTLPRLL